MSDLHPAPADQADSESGGEPPKGSAPVRWPVFIASLVGVLAVAIWTLSAPDQAEAVIGELVAFVSTSFGWFYILLATVILVFVIYLGMSRFGHIRLGPDDSRPEYSTFAWAAMLFAAGIGTDVMFFSVSEPVSQYLNPPVGQGETIDAAREGTFWTLFHYGITGWGMYALMGMALGYFAYRLNLPLAVRSALFPLFGRRINGVLGHAVDTATVLGTIFGVATSLGIGVVLLNAGLNIIFGIAIGTAAQVGLVVLAVIMAAISATTGVDKGIRFLSQLNVILAIALAGWVLVTGNTRFLLDAIVMNVGDFISMFPGMTLQTFAFNDVDEWMSLWTLFFWAWWVAWASFVGMFLARISRGRTIRQFVLGTMVIPFSYIVMWVSIFGNAALSRVRGGDTEFADTAASGSGLGFFNLLQQYPLSGVVIAVAVLVGLLFYVTSADSGALVMGNLSSRLRSVQEDCAPWLRITWAGTTGLLTMGMLLVGGITALQYATIIMGLPFSIVLILVMISLWKALRVEGRRADTTTGTRAHILAARFEGRETWKTRLSRVTNFVSPDDARRDLRDLVLPALQEVSKELNERGVPARVSVEEGERPAVQLTTNASSDPFVYRVQFELVPVPAYGGRMVGSRDQYARLEVHLSAGGQDYDVMGFSNTQLIHDCLDHYEEHVEFLRTAD
ncbi:MAG: choline BCCT transporter BetT [Arthrobacter sp.]|uniref:choline BCCT transporter BetT n=1 Tax=unclassified Arthrobacter TaxID=235627 RepID=UPI0026527F81|nr:choline BCCT transporter BetT [Micrococcaceae bacterium]MDN5812668.1 choline BCCT transporter BetT [Micrococcaceae bacterium]MDN5822994.1 choline BCCT transporter BetT [Micrococcaceae bacterium]MDN5878913.1 choline BCCT transporter BetT [Micrococcaceae bacterium]MDN5886332.1 choline BCCT transporter BetT [Micrococcaceae bacterium]